MFFMKENQLDLDNKTIDGKIGMHSLVFAYTLCLIDRFIPNT